MGLILNIETSSPVCSVCLAKDGEWIDYTENTQKNSHARLLTVMLNDLLHKNSLRLQEINAVAVSAGPGSYTGLRIGVSVAKGLCYALNKPLISVPPLLALAQAIKQSAKEETAYYMPVIDAGRTDVYAAVFHASGNEAVATGCFTVNKQWEERLSSLNKIIAGGSGAYKCRNIFTSSNIRFIDGIECSAKWMTNVSDEKFSMKEFENTAYYQPFYLKEFLHKTLR